MNILEQIKQGETYLGIELGSTRIKSVLLDQSFNVIVTGNYDWENTYKNGVWTYDLDDVWTGLRASYNDLVKNLFSKYKKTLSIVKSIGISGMMHGYLVFDENDELLTPFRTWRNNITGEASDQLRELFNYPIPQRWSISHLYQSILDGNQHVSRVRYMTTLAGYVHWKLTGKKVLGINDASGMFPIDTKKYCFDEGMIKTFNDHIANKTYSWKLEDILPMPLTAGSDSGVLTEVGARLLDESGTLQSQIIMCPPEGDAGTGMVATNSVKVGNGNVSAGTSIFMSVVLEKELSKAYKEIDLVTTPSGHLVAMAHSNNCTSDLDGWVSLFGEFAEVAGMNIDKRGLYEVLYDQALKTDYKDSKMMAYGYLSGEHMTHFTEGRPIFMRHPNSHFTLANFMRTHLMTSLGAMKIGVDLLVEKENVKIKRMLGHGGLFKTKTVGQTLMAAAINVPVDVMETAAEGGAWGIAVLASFMSYVNTGISFETFLNNHVFLNTNYLTIEPNQEDVNIMNDFMKDYKSLLEVEKSAVDNMVEKE